MGDIHGVQGPSPELQPAARELKTQSRGVLSGRQVLLLKGKDQAIRFLEKIKGSFSFEGIRSFSFGKVNKEAIKTKLEKVGGLFAKKLGRTKEQKIGKMLLKKFKDKGSSQITEDNVKFYVEDFLKLQEGSGSFAQDTLALSRFSKNLGTDQETVRGLLDKY